MKRSSAVSILIIIYLSLAACSAFGKETDESRLNLNLKEVPFPEVISNIFSGSQYKFSVAPALGEIKVSATLKNITRDEAIRVVCKSAGVVYKVENNKYVFQPDPQTANVQSWSAPGKSSGTTTGPAKVGVVTLLYISAGDAASLLNASPPDGLQSVTATSVNTLMIKGNVDSISQAGELIKLFDVESALPRSVRVTLSLKFGSAESKNQMKLTTESVGPEGSPIPLSINYSNKEGDECMLDVRLTPNILLDGSVSIAGSGAIDCTKSDGGTDTQRMAKPFEVATSVTPGTTAVVASGSAEGARNMGFVVSVDLLVEKGRVVIPKGGLSSTTTASSGQLSRSSYQLLGTVSSPDESHRKTADALLQQIWDAQPGQGKFDAIDAVAKKYKESDLAEQNAIAWLCTTYMKDKSRGILDRWPCCYVISRSGCDSAVPDLIDVLLHDNHEVIRAVAAEALGGLPENSAARDALLQSERTETSKGVLEVLAKYLGNKNR